MNSKHSAAALFMLAATTWANGPDPAVTTAEAREAAQARLATALSLSAPEPAPEGDDGHLVDWTWKGGLGFQTRDGRVKGKLGGRIQTDLSFLDLDDGLRGAGFDGSDGAEFRRARIFFEGSVDDYFFKAQYDFAGTATDDQDKRPGFKDVYLGKKDLVGNADLKVGNHKEPLSLNELTSSKYITFLERALPNAFAPGRHVGASVYSTAFDEALNWAFGVYKGNTDDAGFAQEDGGYAVTARVSGTPVYSDDGETLVHLGIAYTMRDNESARYRSRPEVHISDRLVDTMALASDDTSTGGIELAGVFGPFHGAAEYMLTSVEGTSGASDFDFSGYYAQLGWFITGESRPYKRSSGVWDKVKPSSPHGEGGYGAVEAAVRYSAIDLTDGGVTGGEENNIALALNWYLNQNVRVSSNFITGKVDLGGALDDETVNALVFRFQFIW